MRGTICLHRVRNDVNPQCRRLSPSCMLFESLMPTTYIIGVLVLLQVAGCAVMRTDPVSNTSQGGTVVVEQLPSAAAQGQSGSAELPQRIELPGGTLIIERLPPLPEVAPQVPVASTPPVPPATPPMAPAAALPETAPLPVTVAPAIPETAAGAGPTDKPAAKAPVKVAAPAVRVPPPQKPVAARVAASTLDLNALEQRLKNTDAIGVFTKIALKNQVDDLLKRFKAYHESDGKSALTQLRQSYDQLLLKVNDVLKNGDPSLAGEIMGSREAIWSVLSDPVKFAKL